MSRDSFHRLGQTRAARIVGVYTATAWGVFEIIDKTVRTFGWSEVIPRTSLVLLIVGLVIVTFTAWAYAGQEVGERTGWRWPTSTSARCPWCAARSSSASCRSVTTLAK